ncbi:hypothetical protein SprV_0200784300 [Sparganum proliferum]
MRRFQLVSEKLHLSGQKQQGGQNVFYLYDCRKGCYLIGCGKYILHNHAFPVRFGRQARTCKVCEFGGKDGATKSFLKHMLVPSVTGATTEIQWHHQ